MYCTIHVLLMIYLRTHYINTLTVLFLDLGAPRMGLLPSVDKDQETKGKNHDLLTRLCE